jgi:hypothetical protein
VSDFSRPPRDHLLANQQRGYVGLHIEQGVPLLDRDLNLLQDLIVAQVRAMFSRYVGNGVADGSEAFRIEPVADPQDFRINSGPEGGRGSCLVDGLDVPILAPVLYSEQPGRKRPTKLTTPAAPQPNPRVDTVYLKAWVEEIDGTPDLANAEDIGAQTSTRLAIAWVVEVAEGGAAPAPDDGQVIYPLATLSRPHGRDTISSAMISDLRRRRLTVAALEHRLSVVERVLLVPSFVPVKPLPALQQFDPTRGPAGTPVTINGFNFDVGKLEVLIGGRPAVLVGVSPNQAVATVPNGLTPDALPTNVKIVVQNEGDARTSDLDFTVEPRLAFAPIGQQIQPPNGPPGTEVTVNGFNFNAGEVVVTFGPTKAAVVKVTNTALRVKVPDTLAPGPIGITVSLPGVSKTTDDKFRVDAIPAPSFVTAGAQFTPPEGTVGTTRVILNGQNFDFGPKVRFGDGDEVVPDEVTATRLGVVVPANVLAAGQTERRVFIVVTTRGGTATSTGQFRAKR